MSNGRSIRCGIASLACISSLLVACSDDGSDGGDPGRKGTPTTATPDTVIGSGTQYRATIRRTEGGVPHITADDLESAAFGQGWASGEDRPCDLIDEVIKINGERARWFGPGDDGVNVESDFAWRTVGIREIADADWSKASGEVRRLMTAYTDGWNAQLDDTGADGIEDWCAGADWIRPLEPVEVYAYARSIALLASSGAVMSMIGTAQPPAPADDSASEGDEAPAGIRGDLEPIVDHEVTFGSNGWAVGSDRSTDGGGMLLANPHFPWEGELRFWEVHLTVPGEVDIYGVQLSGLPGVGIGFTEDFGWTHTVSIGNRFTAYQLDLVDGDPTTYRYGNATRKMTSEDITVEVLGDDDEVTEEARTVWSSHYGPILDFPGLGWSDTTTISIRDANIGNDEFIEQYMQTMTAADLDAFIELHETYTGVPLFNTIATSADGRAWYGDTAATPKLSAEAIAGYEAALESDPFVQIAADNGAILLDGSDPTYEWEEVPGARDPGLVPFDEMPVTERTDYVFNANDSYWVSNADELLEGDFSPLHGRQDVAVSPRTRENAVVLRDTSTEGPAGDDGTFTLDELADASLLNVGFMARELRDDVVEVCDGAGPVTVDALEAGGGEALPAGEVDVTDACRVLSEWDGVYDLDRAGPPLWREFLSRYEYSSLLDAGLLFANPFDPNDPVNTPNGLAGAPDGGTDPVLVNLARAVQVLDVADLKPNVTLGEVQVANRNGELVPIHGGNGTDGTTNVVSWGRMHSTVDPEIIGTSRTTLVPGSSLAKVTDSADDRPAYRITFGTSFLLALNYGPDGPEAKAFLTYGNPAARDDPDFIEATRRFSEKRWRTVAFAEADVADGAESTIVVTG